MRKIKLLCTFFIIFFNLYLLHAQKIGLVLSGGGGKGLAHVGVLKCLEDNGIKVDCIVGTSMGGLVGGFHAAGYSAREIEKIVLSEYFQYWASGKILTKDRFLLPRPDDDAAWISFDLEIDTSFHTVINPVLVNDIALNFELARYLYLPSIQSGFDFDSLPIPFRCLASDVFSQKSVVIKKGQLSDALRASMAVPLFFRPIKIDKKYLFDGGIYNNFGVDIMRQEFAPEVIIGVNVAYNEYPYSDDDELAQNPLRYMLIANSNTALLTEKDILIEPKVTFSATQLDYVKEKIQIGYEATQKQIEEIKKKIKPQLASNFVSQFKRFTDLTETNISNFSVSGVNSHKGRYIRGMFKLKKNQYMSIAELEKRYFRLASFPYFQTLYPRFLPNAAGCYEFNLEVKDRSIFKVQGGGSLSTRGVSMIYGGINFSFLRTKLYSLTLNTYAGTFYTSFQGKLQINYPYRVPFYIEPQITYNKWDYINASELFLPIETFKTNVQRTDRFFGLNIGIGTGNSMKTVASVGRIDNHDDYTNSNTLLSFDTLDITNLQGLLLRVQFIRNTLNRKQFASAGGAEQFSAIYFNGSETHLVGNTSIFDKLPYLAYHQWFRLKASAERYFGQGKYHWGYMVEGVFSNQPAFRNFRSTLINAPAFYPLLDSKTLFLSDFRAFSYAALGIRNIVSLSKKIDFRMEGYLFKPFNRVWEGDKQNPILNGINLSLRDFNLAASSILVYHSPLGPASLNVNYYDDAHYNWSFFLNVGLLIFNKRAMEE
jgi:NTE family protein